jgi:hypothetical protein
VAWYLAVAGVCFLLTQALSRVRTWLGDRVATTIDGAVRDRLTSACVQAPGLASFEDQMQLSALSLVIDGLDDGRRSPGEAVAGLATLSGVYLQAFLAALGIAVLLSPARRARAAARRPVLTAAATEAAE